MHPETQALLTEALRLPDSELEELFAGIVGQLSRWDPDIELAWVEEAERRWQRLQSGETSSIPWEQVRGAALRSIAQAGDDPI